MDKIEDKTEVEKKANLNFDEPRHPKFRGLDYPKISESDLALWEQSPPVAELPSDSHAEKDKKPLRQEVGHCLSVSAVVITLICVWFSFAVPHLCYFHVGFCLQQSGEEESPTAGMIQNCSGLIYTGSQCLNTFGSCPNPLVNIPANGTIESDIATLFFLLDNTDLSSSCKQEKQSVKEFLCTYSYQPCDIDNHAVLPARNVCEYLRDTACSSEWEILSSGQYGSLLPTCGELPSNSTEPSCSNNSIASITSNNDSVSITNNTDDSQGMCNEIVYELGQPCSEYINPCRVDSYVSSTESTLAGLFGLFDTVANDQSCKENKPVVEEFLCHVAFPRCDVDHVTNLPNSSHCEYIRDEVCPNDWIEIQSHPLAGSLIPNCSDLPSLSLEVICIDDTPTQSTTTPSGAPQQPLNTSLDLHCNEDDGFYLYIAENGDNSSLNNTCQPLCSEWSQYSSKALVVADEVIVLLFALIGIIGSIAVIVLSFIRRERMLVFPSIFLVYGIVHTLLLGIVIVIQYIDLKGLSCASNNLVVTTNDNPTIFCQISGFVFLHSILALTYWWFVHICTIFWKIMFPFHAKSHENKGKYIHGVAIILGLILPLTVPSLAFVWDGYSVNRYPPLLCLPKQDDVSYYGVLLPVSFLVTVGITLLVFVLHAIREKSRLFHYRISQTHRFGLSTAEKKLLFIFVYYLVLGYIDIVGFTIGISSPDTVIQYIQENFQCEALRTDPDYVCPRKFEQVTIAVGISLPTYILLGLYPLTSLVFAVNKSEIKVKVVQWFPSFFTESYRQSTLSTSVVTVPDTPFTLRRRLTYQVSTTDHIKHSSEMATIGRSGVYLQKEIDSSNNTAINV